MALIDSTISREKVKIPTYLKVSSTPLGDTFGKSGEQDEPSLCMKCAASQDMGLNRKNGA